MTKRRKRNKLGRFAAVLLILAGLGTAAFYGWQIYSTEKEYKEGDDAYEVILFLEIKKDRLSLKQSVWGNVFYSNLTAMVDAFCIGH